MRSSWKAAGLALLPLLGLTGVGCHGQSTLSGSYNPSAVDPALVSNFESGGSVENSQLYEVGKPSSHVVSPGTFSAGWFDPTLANATVGVAGPGANGTSLACHLTGTIHDPETTPGNFDSLSIQLKPEMSGNYYNASFFTGVQFYVKVSGSDNAASRQFTISIDQTQPPGTPGGTCLSKCYDDFAYDFTSIARDQWVLIRLNFSDLKQGGYGAPANPPDLNSHLDKFIFLTWLEGNAAQSTTFNMDFWLDEVRFF